MTDKYCLHYQQLAKQKKHRFLNINKDSKLMLLFNITFAFIIVIGTSFGLKSLEDGLTNPSNNLLYAQTVLAAETTPQAELVEQSHSDVNIKPDTGFTFTLKYENTGTSTWTKESVYLKSKTTALKFRHEFWPDGFHPAQLKEETVAPGEIGSFVFALQSPGKINPYTGEFLLVDNNKMIKGGSAEISMNVVADPSEYLKTVREKAEATKTATTETVKKTVCTLNLKIAGTGEDIVLDNEACVSKFDLPQEGPNVKVGLFHSEDPITIINNRPWTIYDENDELLAEIKSNTEITVTYIDKMKEFAFDLVTKTIRTEKDLKLVNKFNGIFEVTSHEDRPTWNRSINYNKYTGDLEIKFNDYKERIWLIEDVPLETYLTGMKETSNQTPTEYQKTMTVAARTYAFYHVNRYYGTDPFFDLYSDERDQVYKGYVAAEIMPNQVELVKDTQGIIATFADQVIVAYYSARSGGSTISHSTLPYLKAVETPYTADSSMWGHALGIDMVDAMNRASQEDWTYEDILKYYYTGIDLEKIY
jgi:hypothetical protein